MNTDYNRAPVERRVRHGEIMDIVEKINHDLRTSAPHVTKRETATPLSNAIEEILQLRNPKLINPVKNPRYDDVYEAGIKMLDDA